MRRLFFCAAGRFALWLPDGGRFCTGGRRRFAGRREGVFTGGRASTARRLQAHRSGRKKREGEITFSSFR